MPELLSPRQFAEAIGVSESSVRRWADDGRIEMTRTAGGHRRIARTEAIRFIREQSVDVLRPDLLELEKPPPRQGRGKAFAVQHDQLFAALCDGQANVVLGLLTSMYVAGAGMAEICDGPLRHALQRIGDLWPSDKRSILIEHRATNICIEALNQLRKDFPKAGHSGLAIGGAPKDDPYILPSLMVATVLASEGYEAINLGPNTPLDVLTQAALDLNAVLVWIAFTSPVPKTPMEADLAAAARRLKQRPVPIVVGGRTARRFRMPEVGHLHVLQSMAEMAGFAKSLPKGRSRR
jgi:excisionase family DNA binding protein